MSRNAEFANNRGAVASPRETPQADDELSTAQSVTHCPFSVELLELIIQYVSVSIQDGPIGLKSLSLVSRQVGWIVLPHLLDWSERIEVRLRRIFNDTCDELELSQKTTLRRSRNVVNYKSVLRRFMALGGNPQPSRGVRGYGADLAEAAKEAEERVPVAIERHSEAERRLERQALASWRYRRRLLLENGVEDENGPRAVCERDKGKISRSHITVPGSPTPQVLAPPLSKSVQNTVADALQ